MTILHDVLENYPQPVAYAYRRVLMAQQKNNAIECVDAILRTAEVLTRYLAALAIASFASRKDPTLQPPGVFKTFRGNLSFGKFLDIVGNVSKLKVEHPLQQAFRRVFIGKKNKLSETYQQIVKMLEYRNQKSHQLSSFSEGEAQKLLNNASLFSDLHEILKATAPLCHLPLYYVDTIDFKEQAMHMGHLLLMGEAMDPMPEQVKIAMQTPFPEPKQLYLGVKEGLMPIHPLLLWQVEKERAAWGVYMLHSIDQELGYQSVVVHQPQTTPPAEELTAILEGQQTLLLPTRLLDERSFFTAWQEQRHSRLTGESQHSRAMSWETCDAQSLKWFAHQLRQQHPEHQQHSDLELIRHLLFDGRAELKDSERRQLHLLLGDQKTVQSLLQRYLLDLRVYNGEERISAREEIKGNIIIALRAALNFVFTHSESLADVETNHQGRDRALTQTTGSASYLGLREALVNLFVHQDYEDERMAAQVELAPMHTTLTNPGESLLSLEDLAQGGTSASRNPVVARALKLIGFAELAGSGLRMVRKSFAKEKLPEPVISSENNRFSIRLLHQGHANHEDNDAHVQFWSHTIGQDISADESLILNHCAQAAQKLDLSHLQAECPLPDDVLNQALQRLTLQAILEKTEQGYGLPSHFQNAWVEQA